MKFLIIVSILTTSLLSQARVAFQECGDSRIECTSATSNQIESRRAQIYDFLLNSRQKINLNHPALKQESPDKTMIVSFKNDSSMRTFNNYVETVIQGSCNCRETLDYLDNILEKLNLVSQ